MQNRLQKYIENKKNLGHKRVSFFVNIKVWKHFKRNATKKKMTINEYLIYLLDFK